MIRPSDTIFALSSGGLPAAIAVIRISGPDAPTVAGLFAFNLPRPREAAVRPLKRAGDLLDRALVLFFPAPASATGEDVVELHVHGGRAVVRAVLSSLGDAPGLRRAEPGEFTRRALANGRIDIFEAEALGDLLAAETEFQRRRAMAAPNALARVAEDHRSAILGLSAQVESAIDHDDEIDGGRLEALRTQLGAVAAMLDASLLRPSSSRLRDGFRVVIAGPPNAGKSTLLNRLAAREAAITSPIAGTTRDLIDVDAAIGGVPVRLIDTAGLRATADPIESIGIAKAEDAIAGADVLVWLGDLPAPAGAAVTIAIIAKADLHPNGTNIDALRVSASTGEGMHELMRRIQNAIFELVPPDDEALWNDRQRGLISAVAAFLHAGAASPDIVMMAEELRAARDALDRLCGHAGIEDMLDALFARFCHGK